MRRRFSRAELRAAWWALTALRAARRDLRAHGLREVRVAAPPPLPVRAGRGVTAVLSRTDPSCLERSLVLQRWLAAHGEPHDVIVGVTGPRGFRAHAWLAGEAPPAAPGFTEIARLAP